LERLDNV